MKIFKLSLIALFNLIFLKSFSQGEFIIEIDRTNGSYIKTGPLISGVTYIYPNLSAFDENNGVFIFPSADNPTRLYSINVSNDSVINNPVYSNLLVEFEYSNSLYTLYGLFKDNINDVKYFASINPTTGTYTQIGDAIPSSGTYQGKSTFDQINNRYIFIDGSNEIFSIDANTGNVISNPLLVLASDEQLLNISYDDSTNILYGIILDNIINKHYLVSINTNSGIITKIGNGATFGNNGSSTIDQINQQFIYLYYNSNGLYAIATIDIMTGNQ
jgi:hypothetical protein